MMNFTRNKHILILPVAFLVIVSAFFYKPSFEYIKSERQPSEISGSSIEAVPAFYDFGSIRYQDISKREFEIKNRGNENLEILKISTSCGCTKAEMSEGARIIAPGASTTLIVTMDPASHKSYFDLGLIKRVVYMKTNDKNKPEIEIELTANVLRPENSETFEIRAENGKFVPGEVKVKENSFVELKLASADNKYELKIDEFGVYKEFDPGNVESIVFKADKKGTFVIYGGAISGKLTVY